MRNYYDQTAAWPPRRRGGRTAVVCFLIAIALLVGVAVLLRLLPAAELELPEGADSLYFTYRGPGSASFKGFTLRKD